MSNLGWLIGYTDDPCPNCGRYRVEKWSSGKRVCEKCKWCIEDGEYFHEEDEGSYWDFVSFGRAIL